MKDSIQRLGNVRLSKGIIVPIPEHPRTYKLRELLSQITKRNLHRGVMTGAPSGKEIW